MGRKAKVMSQKRSREKVAVEMYLDALATYLREHQDAGPRQLMKDLPEVGDLRALDGAALKLYEQAVDLSLKMGEGRRFSLERVKSTLVHAQKMLD